MIIRVQIEAHAFAEEKLIDWVFEDPPHYGIVGPEVMLPLAQARGKIISVEYSELTTLKDFEIAVTKQIWDRPFEPWMTRPFFSFVVENERLFIGNPNANFSYLLAKYIDQDNSRQIKVCFLVCNDAGVIEPRGGQLRYFMRSHEEGKHHVPHVHVEHVGHQFEATVQISNGEILAGKLPGKYGVKVKKEILENQEYYYDCWNKLTDGLKADVNQHFHLVYY